MLQRPSVCLSSVTYVITAKRNGVKNCLKTQIRNGLWGIE